MARLSQECAQAVGRYVALRYHHWTKGERTRQRKRVMRELKRQTPERQEQYVQEVREFLELNGQTL